MLKQIIRPVSSILWRRTLSLNLYQCLPEEPRPEALRKLLASASEGSNVSEGMPLVTYINMLVQNYVHRAVRISGATPLTSNRTRSNSEIPGRGVLPRQGQLETKMTSTIDTSQQSASAHGCCGGQASKEKAALAVAKTQAVPSSAAKRSAPAEAAGSCCHGEGHPDEEHKKHDGRQP